MRLEKLSMEELEQYSHNDLAYEILKERKKRMATPEIFREICNLLNYSEDYFFEAIADFYTSLNLDKRFKLVDNKEWDLRENYPNDKDDEMDDDDEEEEEVAELDEEEDVPPENEAETEDEMEDPEEDGLEDLTIVSDDELDEE